MKELRNEKQVTQEQLSEVLGVSNRTISRWETGNNMPDIVLLMQISEFYDVDLRELLHGERDNESMDKKTKETILKVAEYDNEENLKIINKINRFSVIGVFSLVIYIILLRGIPNETPFSEFVAGIMLGLSFASMIVSMIHTTKYGVEIKAFKLRVLEKMKQ